LLSKDYSFFSRILHYFLLGSNIISEMMLDIEMALFNKKIVRDNSKPHIFISGFPRSGTTILMRSLYKTGQFASLTYRDMPAVISPNLWSKILSNKIKSKPPKQRAHGDEIKINIDSPEALEEVFWRIKLNKKYIYLDKLTIHEVDEETINEYRNFVSLILYKYNKKLYISKNNNNLLRLESIIKAFPNCLILIPFRDPLQQAYSLLLQHQNFTKIQNENKFVKKYMSYLVHHEFGAIHRPYEFTKNSKHEFDNNSLEYWLAQWINAYDYLSQEKFFEKKNIMYINYEYLCKNPQKVFKDIIKKTKLYSLPFENNCKFKLSFKKIDIQKSILQLKASKIFEKLNKLATRS